MKRTLICTVEIDLEELPDAEREECCGPAGCTLDELPSLADIGPSDLVESVEGVIEHAEDFFAGTEMYAKIVAVRASNPVWKKK